MEKVRPWCGQLSDRERLKNRTEQCRPLARSDMLEYAAPKLPDTGPTQHWFPGSNTRPHHKKGTSICSAVFAELTDASQHTNRHTDHATTLVTMGRVLCCAQ